MANDDIYSLLSASEPDAQTQAQAMAAALRRQQGVGTLALLTGDPTLSKVGQAQLDQADSGQRQLASAASTRLSKALETQRMKQQQDYQNSELGIRRASLAREDVVPVQTGAGVFLLNKRTGEYKPLADKDGNPVAPKGAGGAGGGGLNAKQLDNDWMKFGDSVSTVRGRNSLLPKYQASIDRAGRLEALLKLPDGSLANATPQQVREASTALASLISGGGPGALQQIQELTPETYASEFANFKQKLLNEPQGADAQAFLQNMLDTAHRETALARQQLRAGQVQSIPTFAHLRKTDKARFDSTLKAAGIDPSTIDDNGLMIQAQQAAAEGGANPAAEKARKWLAQNPNHPKAAEVRAKLQAMGGG